jgi:protoporphyrinogen oxidase
MRLQRPSIPKAISMASETSSAPQSAESTEHPDRGNIVVIGAGPAGLTAAYQLGKAGRTSTVLEADNVVGGISRTAERDGWRFDIGGHRFFTKVRSVEALWHEILPAGDFLLRPRKSRIFYDGKYYDYPLRAFNALKNLGPVEAVLCLASYVMARIRPPKDQSDYESWLVARFGWRLYRTFFKTYTEKVWGVPVSSMPADWAAQRIKNLSLVSAVINALLPKRNQKDITSLIEEFEYPKFGPGMMWEVCRDKVVDMGSSVVMEAPVSKIRHADGRATAVVTADGTEYPADHVISSMPMAQLLQVMDPPVDVTTRAAADDLQFRDFLTVALVVPESQGFEDNWIYIHSPDVKVGRIQNFGQWSPYMVKPGYTCLGLEYFVFEGDELWDAPDEELIARAKRELAHLGLVPANLIENAGYVVRIPKAYPTYDQFYQGNVEVLKKWLAVNATNVWPVGRNGMHKYNNQDHSMLTAMLTVENIVDDAQHDIWAVNVEEEYHEESSGKPEAGTGRDAPIIPRHTAS